MISRSNFFGGDWESFGLSGHLWTCIRESKLLLGVSCGRTAHTGVAEQPLWVSPGNTAMAWEPMGPKSPHDTWTASTWGSAGLQVLQDRKFDKFPEELNRGEYIRYRCLRYDSNIFFPDRKTNIRDLKEEKHGQDNNHWQIQRQATPPGQQWQYGSC